MITAIQNFATTENCVALAIIVLAFVGLVQMSLLRNLCPQPHAGSGKGLHGFMRCCSNAPDSLYPCDSY